MILTGGICVELMKVPQKERHVAGEMLGSRREGAAGKRVEKRVEKRGGKTFRISRIRGGFVELVPPKVDAGKC